MSTKTFEQMVAARINDYRIEPLTNADAKAAWLSALRSGNFGQTKTQLRNLFDLNRFCCLGVMCEVFKDAVNGEWKKDLFGIKDEQRYVGGYPPLAVTKYVGMTDDTQRFISGLNDDGATFAEIADYIEANL
jgi:hypothetical protein